MNTLPRIPIALSALCLVATLAHAGDEGEACWQQTGQSFLPMSSNPPRYVCYSVGIVSSSYAQAFADGATSSGGGRAWDKEIGCEGQVRTAAATGIESQAWNNPCGDGEIEFSGQADIAGQTNLMDDDCAGAALGYQEITSNVLSGPITAVLTQSVGQTNAGELGDVSAGLEGLQINIPITSGLGEGLYVDNDQDQGFAYSCSDFFTVEHRSRAYIRVWANSPFFDLHAEVRATMAGYSTSSTYLGTCPD